LLKRNGRGPRPGPCAKFVLGLFGSLFLIALLFVPCTTTTSSLRTDPYSQVVMRTTHPRNSYIFLPQYLSMKAHPREGRTVRARSFQRASFMIIIAVLGLLDYAIFCRLFRRRRPPADGADPDEDGPPPSGRSSSSLSLFS
jgi:hypothetical protein